MQIKLVKKAILLILQCNKILIHKNNIKMTTKIHSHEVSYNIIVDWHATL